jgi:hypothetical protein
MALGQFRKQVDLTGLKVVAGAGRSCGLLLFLSTLDADPLLPFLRR